EKEISELQQRLKTLEGLGVDVESDRIREEHARTESQLRKIGRQIETEQKVVAQEQKRLTTEAKRLFQAAGRELVDQTKLKGIGTQQKTTRVKLKKLQSAESHLRMIKGGRFVPIRPRSFRKIKK
ncbi:hypothetical protein ACFLY6_03510, partial [Candidatus Dependentiae bacterium]